MENQHREIRGYREPRPGKEVLELMNQVKDAGHELAILVERLQNARFPDGEHGERIGVDMRWLSIGRTDLQTGLMALTRSVAQPGFF